MNILLNLFYETNTNKKNNKNNKKNNKNNNIIKNMKSSQKIGNYKLYKTIGEGAFAKVRSKFIIN